MNFNLEIDWNNYAVHISLDDLRESRTDEYEDSDEERERQEEMYQNYVEDYGENTYNELLFRFESIAQSQEETPETRRLAGVIITLLNNIVE